MMLCAKFGWNWLSGSGEEYFKFHGLYFHYFVIIFPWKRAGPSFEQTWIPYTQGCFVPSWLKLAQWFWRRRFFNFINVISSFRNYLPFERGGAFISTNLYPLHPRMLCVKFGWNWLSGSGEEDENVKSLRQRRRQRQQRRRTTHKFWSGKLTWAFGSGELKTLVL